MAKLMIIVGSVRPGRIGISIADWVRSAAESTGRWEIDFVDLLELGLPFMDEPQHPVKREYTKPHTFAWSARVEAADAIILVSPEYNHSFSPALKNALDFLSQEWRRKPVGFASYGGNSAGTRGVAALKTVVNVLGMVPAAAAVEINFPTQLVDDEGVFVPDDRHQAALTAQLGELAVLAETLRPLQKR